MPTPRISQLAAAAALAGTELIEVSQLSATVTLTATDLSALAADNSYNSAAAAFATAGFVAGMAVKVTGFTGNVANNITSAVVTAVTAGKLTIGGTDGDVIVDDAAGESVTITAWVSVRSTAQDVANLSAAAAKVPAQRYTIELANTTDSDPGAGLVKFNNATPASATQLYIDDSTSDGVDLSTYFASLGATGFLKIQSAADAGEWAIFKWTATTDGTGYWKFTVVPQASKGTLDDADEVLIEFESDAAGGSGGSASSGSYASRPSAATAGSGAIYYATDVKEQYLSDGAAWTCIGGQRILAVAQSTSAFVRTANTYADVTGISVTCMVGERPITIRAHAIASHTVDANYVGVNVLSNGVSKSEGLFQAAGGGGYGQVNCLGYDSGLAPGSTYTFKMQMQNNSGSGTAQLAATANAPTVLMVEAG